jgi:hypothetical protein
VLVCALLNFCTAYKGCLPTVGSCSSLWHFGSAPCTGWFNLCSKYRLLCCRYFTVPFMLLALHMRPPKSWHLVLTGAVYAAVNAATIYMFLFRPYTWSDGRVARFMW